MRQDCLHTAGREQVWVRSALCSLSFKHQYSVRQRIILAVSRKCHPDEHLVSCVSWLELSHFEYSKAPLYVQGQKDKEANSSIGWELRKGCFQGQMQVKKLLPSTSHSKTRRTHAVPHPFPGDMCIYLGSYHEPIPLHLRELRWESTGDWINVSLVEWWRVCVLSSRDIQCSVSFLFGVRN